MTVQLLLDHIRPILEGSKDGTLLLGNQSEIIKVFCRQGLIEAVSSNLEQYHLGQHLVTEGFMEASAVQPLLAESRRQGVPIGEAALRSKLLEPAELADVIRRQAFQLLRHALEKQFSVQSFQVSATGFSVPAQIHFENLLLEVARGDSKPFQVYPWQLVVMKNGKDLTHLPWYPQELSVLSELRRSRTLQDLATATGLEYVRLTKILDVFRKLEVVDIVDEETGQDDTKGSAAVGGQSRFPFEHLIPEISNAVLSEKLEVLKNEFSFVSEQFKALKVRINETQADHAVQTIAISSPRPQDGKSLIAVNLAFCLAQDLDRRVILVDCDLRNPTVNRYLGVSVEPGLSGYLENGHLQPYCYMRRFKNLYIMTAGGVCTNPVELLSQDKMRELIQYLKTEFDTIIFDAPPFAPIPDTRIIMGLSDGLVLVVRRGKTPYSAIEKAFKVLDRKKLLGAVFNDVKPMLLHTHYDHGYYRYGKQGAYPYYGTRKPRSRSKNYLES